MALAATAADADGTIAKVDFYAGATLIGSATTAPYTASWTNVPAGTYSLTAVATDDRGTTTTSAAVPVVVDAPPSVTLTSPAAGAVGIAPASFTLAATASDSDGLSSVAFYQNGVLIQTVLAPPFAASWANVQPGNYTLTAVATDSLGVQTTSAPVAVTVVANSAPTVSLTSPTPNQTYKAPASIALATLATDPDNNLAQVEFFQNGVLIQTVLAPPFAASWANVQPGNYTLTAVATDSLGAQTTSAPVSITVNPAQASLYFIHPDHLGTPRLVTDEGGNVVWRNLPTSEPFGNSPPEEDPNSTGSRFEFNLRFPGQYADQESNLSYNYFRDYDPSTGRYVQSDPIGLEGGINTYTYVLSNPMSLTDPLGLIPPGAEPECFRRGDCKCVTPECAAGLTPNKPLPNEKCIKKCMKARWPVCGITMGSGVPAAGPICTGGVFLICTVLCENPEPPSCQVGDISAP